MNRSGCVSYILRNIDSDTIIVASTGFISRELYKQQDRDLNFYMMGSMGSGLGIGIGMALTLNKNRIIVINGDGSALMSLGTLITAEKLRKEGKLNNLSHYVLDNNCHESTGAQRTNSQLINFSHLFKNTIVYKCETQKEIPPRINLTPKQITERFQRALIRK